ncbi:methyl-accepting chemotaxis protein [Allocoleopsis sp.]|uniref:methyl-accepting chemotaxis protein n=1 Tax=Allocoleopsis sp. TaxID=3088169 RepID=UPI002FCF9CEA
MTQIPPRNSFEKTTHEGHLTSNGFPIGGQIPAIEESPSFSTLLPSQTSEPSEKTRSLPLQKRQNPWWRLRSLNFTSLRTKTTILALAIGTIPVMLVGTTAYFTAGRGIEEQIVQSETSNAEGLEDKLNLFIKERFSDIITLSQLDAFTNPKVRDALTTEEKNAILKDLMESSKVYNSIVVYNPKADELIASGGGKIDLQQILKADYTQAAQETDRPAIVDPRPNTATGEFSFFVAAPVKSKATSKTIAFVRIRTSMGLINNLFKVNAKRGQEFYVTDSKGQITASSNPQALQKKLADLFPNVSSQIQKAGKQRLTTIATEKGKEQIFTYVPNKELANGYGLNWGLVVARPTDIAFAPQKHLLLTLIVGTGFFALVVAAIAIYVANRATKPIVSATDAVIKIGQGELDTYLEVQGSDELALLGDTINNMAGQLKGLLGEKEQAAEEQRQLTIMLQNRVLELLEEVEPINDGDLTIRATVTADDIGTIADSYNFMVANLREIVTKVQAAASNVAETTSNNELSVQTLSQEALRQAEDITVALTQVQEMAQSSRHVALSAEKAAQVVRRASQTVEEGDAAINRTVEGIVAIRETVSQTRQKVKYLGESSQKISTVVNLISEFASQTKMLAFNASIEATRAGEQGRGFAIVADEVRTLAQQSAEASREIEKLIAAIQGETNEVIAAMEAGTEQVVMGTKLVDETRLSLNKITVASAEVSQLVEEIAQAAIQQSGVSETVTQTITQVAQIAEQTSKEATVVSSSFEQLQRVAQALQEDVAQFKVS